MQLPRLSLACGASEEECDVDIVIIPEYAKSPNPQDWGICTTANLTSWQTLGLHPRILTFSNGMRLTEGFTYHTILVEGRILLDALLDSRKSREKSSWRPLLFVCHGFGGILLKQALFIAEFESDRYSALLHTVYGVIFLGTPHGVTCAGRLSQATENILHCSLDTQLSKLKLATLKQDLETLLVVARGFVDIKLDIHILTVYEASPTTIRKRSLMPDKKTIVVDLNVARILDKDNERETYVSLRTDHFGLYKMQSSSGKLHPDIDTWLRRVLGDAPASIRKRMQTYVLVEPPESYSPSACLASSVNAIKRNWTFVNESEPSNQAYYDSSDDDHEIVVLLSSLKAEKKLASLPCHSMGPYAQNPDFCGRQDVLQILEDALVLQQQTETSSKLEDLKCTVICGAGGIGKTEIALEFVHSRKHRFDAIFWIRADDLQKLEADFADIPAALGLEDKDDNTRQQVASRELAKGWLSEPTNTFDREQNVTGQPNASWLIVFDNADDPNVLHDYSKIFGRGSILVTTRHPGIRDDFPLDTLNIDLEPFTDEEGAQMLEKLTRKHDMFSSKRISRELGGFPLAISQMAGVIRTQFLSLSVFLERYNSISEHGALLKRSLGPQSHSTARGNVATIWALDELRRTTRSLLEAAVFLDPDTVPERVLLGISGKLPFPRYFPQGSDAFYEARAELIASSLIRPNEDTRQWRIHRVLQDTLLVHLEERDLIELFSNAVSMVDSVWPASKEERRHDVSRWSACKDLYPHIIWLKDAYLKIPSLIKVPDVFKLATLLAEGAWYQHEIGKSREVKPLLDLVEQLHHQCHPEQGRQLICQVHRCFSAIASGTNDANLCIKHTNALLRIRLQEKEQDKTHQVTIELGVAYNEHGLALMMHDKIGEAVKHFEEAIKIYKSIPKMTKQMLPVPLVNVGLAYWLRGEYDIASSTLEFGLDIVEELEMKSFRTGRMLHALGNVKYSQGKIDESTQCYIDALRSHTSTIGRKHHRTADVCFKMAQDQMRRDNLMAAKEFIDDALTIWNMDSLAYRNELARAFFFKSKILFEIDQNDLEATKLLDKAAVLRTEILGSSEKARRNLTEEDFDSLVMFWSR